MTHSQGSVVPRMQDIFHPSDFTEASGVAFAHALKFALVGRAKLTVYHVSGDSHVDWEDFPGVRETLERWNILPPNSPKSAVIELGLQVRKYVSRHKDPVRAALAYLGKHPTDLIVLATSQHEGRMRWLQTSVAEPIARESRQMTLFIPHGVNGFVSNRDGSLSLRSILIPIDTDPSPQIAIEAACGAARALQCPQVTLTLLHIGDPGDIPACEVKEQEGWDFHKLTKQGDVVDTILETANDFSADLIVMTTAGRDGFLDALRGSTTERVLRKANCPVLAVPAGLSETSADRHS
jgi:nucleotide-binding universal stress UspA family protein